MLMNEPDTSTQSNGAALLRNHPEEPTNGRRGIVNSSMALAQIVKLMLQSPTTDTSACRISNGWCCLR